jgi:hypothetical protein
MKTYCIALRLSATLGLFDILKSLTRYFVDAYSSNRAELSSIKARFTVVMYANARSYTCICTLGRRTKYVLYGYGTVIVWHCTLKYVESHQRTQPNCLKIKKTVVCKQKQQAGKQAYLPRIRLPLQLPIVTVF